MEQVSRQYCHFHRAHTYRTLYTLKCRMLIHKQSLSKNTPTTYLLRRILVVTKEDNLTVYKLMILYTLYILEYTF